MIKLHFFLNFKAMADHQTEEKLWGKRRHKTCKSRCFFAGDKWSSECYSKTIFESVLIYLFSAKLQ